MDVKWIALILTPWKVTPTVFIDIQINVHGLQNEQVMLCDRVLFHGTKE